MLDVGGTLAVTGCKGRIHQLIEHLGARAGTATIVTPGNYTRGESFDRAAMAVDDPATVEFAAIEALFG